MPGPATTPSRPALLRGYGPLGAFACPSCGANYAMLTEGRTTNEVHVTCWCGGNGYVRRDDRDVAAVLGAKNVDGTHQPAQDPR